MIRRETTPSSSSCSTINSIESLGDVLSPLKGNLRRLYLVRHGETDMNAQGILQGDGIDSILTTKGQSQARSVADILVDQPIQSVLSSDLKRSVETANIIHEKLTRSTSSPESYISRITSSKFREMKFGKFEGTPILRKDCSLSIKLRFAVCRPAMRKNHDKQWPSGESIAELHHRAMDGLTPIMEQTSNNTVCLVAHGACNKLLIHCLTGIDEREIQQSNTGVSVLDFNPSTGDWIVRVLDFDGHAQQSSAEESKHLSSSLVAPRQSMKMSFQDKSLRTTTPPNDNSLRKTLKSKQESAWNHFFGFRHRNRSRFTASFRTEESSSHICRSGPSLEVHHLSNGSDSMASLA